MTTLTIARSLDWLTSSDMAEVIGLTQPRCRVLVKSRRIPGEKRAGQWGTTPGVALGWREGVRDRDDLEMLDEMSKAHASLEEINAAIVDMLERRAS